MNSGKKSCRRFQKSADVEDYSVNASITTLNGFSAHADQKKLLQWAEALPQRWSYKKDKINHSENETASNLTALIVSVGLGDVKEAVYNEKAINWLKG